jgi:hypothetical protein
VTVAYLARKESIAMKHAFLTAALLVAAGLSGQAAAQESVVLVPSQNPWHHGYYHTMYGRPVAMVVPPTLTHQTNWGWGVGNTRITPVYPQYAGPTMGDGGGYFNNRPTPHYVSDTLQFGVYYIRGPW